MKWHVDLLLFGRQSIMCSPMALDGILFWNVRGLNSKAHQDGT
jgi:hypothetical protein